MAVSDDSIYYARRLEEELARAQNEPAEHMRQLHREWAHLYSMRLDKILQQTGPVFASA